MEGSWHNWRVRCNRRFRFVSSRSARSPFSYACRGDPDRVEARVPSSETLFRFGRAVFSSVRRRTRSPILRLTHAGRCVERNQRRGRAIFRRAQEDTSLVTRNTGNAEEDDDARGPRVPARRESDEPPRSALRKERGASYTSILARTTEKEVRPRHSSFFLSATVSTLMHAFFLLYSFPILPRTEVQREREREGGRGDTGEHPKTPCRACTRPPLACVRARSGLAVFGPRDTRAFLCEKQLARSLVRSPLALLTLAYTLAHTCTRTHTRDANACTRARATAKREERKGPL